MKILLILPFNTYGGIYNNEIILRNGGEAEIPLGLGYLKSYVKSKIPEVEIEIYDSNIDAMNYIINCDNNVSMEFLWDRLNKKIINYNPDIVGVSAFSHAVADEAHKVVALCKNINEKIITVMGGSYPTLSYDCAMEDENLDIVIQSEGEVIFYNFVKIILNNDSLSKVKGIVYRDNGKIIVNPMEQKIQNLDDLPYPDLEDLPIALYGKLPRHSLQRTIKNLKPISMVSARGCVYHCGFCATKKVWGTVRHRSAKNIVEEIKYLKNKYDINFVKFNDDLFTHDHERVIEICDLLIREKIIENWSSTGVTVQSLLDKKMVEKMVASGYRYFSLPIDSGCENTLKSINKPLKLNMVKEVIGNLRQYKEVYIGAAFIVGFPFETKEDIQQTYDFASSMDLNWASFNIFVPFPKTRLYDECIQKGYLPNKKIEYNDLQNTNILSTPNFDKEWLRDYNYYNNLKINFVNNHAIKKHDYISAINEFKFILKIAPDHAFALLFIGYSYDMLGNKGEAKLYYEKANYIFKNDSFWGNYLKSLEKEIKSKMTGRICL